MSLPGQPHLTYCTNIHAGESWDEIFRNIERYAPAVKAKVSPHAPLGIGLRLSASAAETLERPAPLGAFQDFLNSSQLYVFTINGFPYGPFHGTRVKESVYRPDWLEEARLVYTNRLARLLSRLLPEGLEGSISTVPGAFKARAARALGEERMSEFLLRHLAAQWDIERQTGKVVSLALEPEPFCHLETVAETTGFFERCLYSAGAARRFCRLTGLGKKEAALFIRRHLGVCFDACHMAVEFEEPQAALWAFKRAGIAILKIQLSAGLKISWNARRAEQLGCLRELADGVYLHQVVERGRRGLIRYLDLPQALKSMERRRDSGEWRVHFHVPVFRGNLGSLGNTQDDLKKLLSHIRDHGASSHLEVETYCWEVIPERFRRHGIVASIAREMKWVLKELAP